MIEFKRRLCKLFCCQIGGRGPGAQIIALTFRTACDDLTPQARGADPKQRCLELKTELEQNYKACTLYIFVHSYFLMDFCLLFGQAREGHIRNCVSVMEEKVLTSY